MQLYLKVCSLFLPLLLAEKDYSTDNDRGWSICDRRGAAGASLEFKQRVTDNGPGDRGRYWSAAAAGDGPGGLGSVAERE